MASGVICHREFVCEESNSLLDISPRHSGARPWKRQLLEPLTTKGLLQSPHAPHAPPELSRDHPLSTFSCSWPACRPCTILECPHLRSRHQLARHQRCENLL